MLRGPDFCSPDTKACSPNRADHHVYEDDSTSKLRAKLIFRWGMSSARRAQIREILLTNAT